VNALRFDGLKLKLEMSDCFDLILCCGMTTQVKPLTFSERSQEVLGSLVRQLLHWRNVFSETWGWHMLACIINGWKSMHNTYYHTLRDSLCILNVSTCVT
jgi:hypothetical protein